MAALTLEAGLADAMIPFYLEFVKLTRLAVLFLVVFAVSYALGYVDQALRLALRGALKSDLGADAKVDAVELALARASFAVRGIACDSWAGFVEPRWLEVAAAEASLASWTQWLAVATGPTVRVDRLRLAGVRVWIERREQDGVYNLVLLPKKNAHKRAPPPDAPAEAAAVAPPRPR